MEKKTDCNSIWNPNLNHDFYKNPIIHQDYSDPDVIKVGDDFFLVASSFNCVPGLPVLHSKDLINWRIINYAVKRLPSPEYDEPQIGKGIWAPAIRYNNNKFFIYFSMPDDGIYVTFTEDPFKEWSQIKLIKKAKGWIDPCPFWDEDGKAYIVNAFAKSRIGFNSKLCISRLSDDGMEILDEGVIVFDGIKTQPTIEGPKLYKRNGYYYIFAPAGGVTNGWQTVLRSKNIYGPYEEKIVLHQGPTVVNGPHQGAWVELENDEHWFIHFQDKGSYGRIVHLQPMKWIDDWPIIGEDINGDGIGEPVLECKKPNTVYKNCTDYFLQCSDFFEKDYLSLQWQWNANPNSMWYSLTDRKGYLRLYTIHSNQDFLINQPNLLLQKIPAPSFKVTTKLEFSPQNINDMAGLIISGHSYSALLINKNDKNFTLKQIVGEVQGNQINQREVFQTEIDTNKVFLSLYMLETGESYFKYSCDGIDFKVIGDSFIPKEDVWAGSKVGLVCLSKSQDNNRHGFADFAYFLFDKI